MREFYLFSSIGLGICAAWAIYGVASYEPKTVTNYDESMTFVYKGEELKREQVQTNFRDSEPISAKNLFDINRGEEGDAVVIADPEPEVPEERYQFELGGIHMLGGKKMALLSATPVSQSRSSSRFRGRTPVPGTNIPQAPSRSAQPFDWVLEGNEIPNTTYIVEKVEYGKVTIKDKKGGLSETLEFSLTSDSALQRSEQAYKAEMARMKQFSNQNSFEPVTDKNQPDGADHQGKNKLQNENLSVQDREALVRKRAEQLREEMSRLRELREGEQRNNNQNEANQNQPEQPQTESQPKAEETVTWDPVQTDVKVKTHQKKDKKGQE